MAADAGAKLEGSPLRMLRHMAEGIGVIEFLYGCIFAG
jgi:hypothetical protein